MVEEINRQGIHRQPYLNGRHLRYVLKEAVPSSVDFEKDEVDEDDEKIEKKVGEIHNRLNTLIEDLVLLQESDLVTDEQWEEVWESLSESTHAFFRDNSLDSFESSYELGVHLGHLAYLLAHPNRISPAETPYEKKKHAIQAGFVIGINRNGLLGSEEDVAELHPHLQPHKYMDLTWDRGPDEFGFPGINEFEENITSAVERKGPIVLDTIKYHIKESNLESTPLIQNMVFEVFEELAETFSYTYADFELAVEFVESRYSDDFERATLLAEEVKQELTKLFDPEPGLLGRKVDPLRGRELLRAAYIESRSKTENLADIVQTTRNGQKGRGWVSGQHVKGGLNRMKGLKQMGSEWEEDPIIKNDGTPTDFGKLVAKISMPNSVIRDTDRYLPTRMYKKFYINPSFDEIEYACKAFALDCPAESPEESWETIFRNACQDRL
jgi:hypothetical protein